MLGAIILGLLMQDPALPQWARDDPFAWERARCHPQIRGDTPLESCQFRVRQRLALELGDQLPEALRPTSELQACAYAQAEAGFAVQCDQPREVRGPSTPQLREQARCSTRPRARPDGGVIWEEVCDPSSTRDEDNGLRINLSGQN
ncbi:MAG: hypothetical protein V7672_01645 [Brevundimonas sp.]|uniref:hypothetical protein n=1 Tax=Brevundimonas sp. TaxID=1871086 RepID=UPI0030031BEE